MWSLVLVKGSDNNVVMDIPGGGGGGVSVQILFCRAYLPTDGGPETTYLFLEYFGESTTTNTQ